VVCHQQRPPESQLCGDGAQLGDGAWSKHQACARLKIESRQPLAFCGRRRYDIAR